MANTTTQTKLPDPTTSPYQQTSGSTPLAPNPQAPGSSGSLMQTMMNAPPAGYDDHAPLPPAPTQGFTGDDHAPVQQQTGNSNAAGSGIAAEGPTWSDGPMLAPSSPSSPASPTSGGSGVTAEGPTWSDGPMLAPGSENPAAPPASPAAPPGPTTVPTVPPTSPVPTTPTGNVVTTDPQNPPPVADFPTVANTRTGDTQALINQLTQRANQGTLVDPNDPVIKGQVDSYAAQQERAAKNYAADQAEKNSPYATGANENVQRMMAETAGQNTGQFQASLVQNELNNRRSEIQNALTQLGSVLTDEQKGNLQAELANLNAAVSHSGQAIQQQQFYANLNQNDKQFVNQLTQNERFKNMDDALSRYTLAQQQAQFVSTLGQQSDFKKLDEQFRRDQLSTQDSEFLKNLAQQGKFNDMQQEYLRLKMSSDSNNFLAQLAQNGQLAQMDDVFKKMQLAQQGLEFGAQLGQNESQFLDNMGLNLGNTQNFWDALQRGLPTNGGG